MRKTAPLFPAFLLLLAHGPVLATTFIAQDFSAVVDGTPVVVHGTVGSNYADWVRGGDGSRRIYTFYDFQISEVLKGSVSGSSLVFREMGGEKDGVGMSVSGTAHFDRGEDVVVLLSERNPDGSYDLRDMMMGKLNVQHDDSSGADLLRGPALSQQAGMLVHGDDDSGAPKQKKQWTLDSLRQLIASPPKGPRHAGASASGAAPAPVATTPPNTGQAPALQPSGSEEGPNRFGPRVRALLLALLALFALALFNRKRRSRPRAKR